MKVLKFICGGVLFALPLQAQVFESYSFTTFNGNPSLPIPDANATGVEDNRTITSAISQLGSVRVTLDITGDFNGDLYLYLRHDSGFSVLLNRPGRSASNLAGYDDSGFNITLRDDAANDVHNY